MPSKYFTPVNWSPGQLIDEDSLDQMNNNEVYLRDQMVDGKYMFDWGGQVDTGIKMMCGRVYLPPNGNITVTYGTVAFPQMFTPESQPIITATLLSQEQCAHEYIVRGIGTFFPDHRGFQFKVRISQAYAKKTLDQPLYFMWMAMGY